MPSPLHIIGGYGVTGQQLVRLLSHHHPDLPLAIAGRDLRKAQTLATEVGAIGQVLDLTASDAGLGDAASSGLVVLAKDSGLHALRWAQDRGVPYLSLSSAAFEIGVDLLHAMARPGAAPVVIAGHWFAGAVSMATLDVCEKFDRVESVVVGITIDRNSAAAGAASLADFERVARSSCATLARIAGNYVWQQEADSIRSYEGVSGAMMEGKGSVSVDVPTIGARTNARDVHVLETWGDSAHFLETGIPADEIAIEVVGLIDGQMAVARRTLVLPHTAASMTSVSLLVTVERMLGLEGGPAIGPGVWTTDQLQPPAAYMQRIQALGVQVRTSLA